MNLCQYSHQKHVHRRKHLCVQYVFFAAALDEHPRTSSWDGAGAVDLDNFQSPRGKRGFISGPGYAESVMSIFV